MTCRARSTFRPTHQQTADRDDMNADAGMGLIEVVVALTVLAIIFASVGWLITSSLAASELAKQRATAASIIAEVDSYVQAGVPQLPPGTKTCSDDGGSGTVQAYIATRYGGGVKYYADQGQGSTKYTIATTLGTTTKSGGSRVVPVTVQVTWLAATPNQKDTLTNVFQVPCY